jgi:hypothetical protein
MLMEFVLQGEENYGTPQAPYWKFKSGGEYLLTVDQKAFEAALDKSEFFNSLAERATPVLTISNEYWKQYVVNWQVVEDSHYTDFELSQLEYEGHITYWATYFELPPVSLAA